MSGVRQAPPHRTSIDFNQGLHTAQCKGPEMHEFHCIYECLADGGVQSIHTIIAGRFLMSSPKQPVRIIVTLAVNQDLH